MKITELPFGMSLIRRLAYSNACMRKAIILHILLSYT